jgi:predicted DNA-binding protein
MGKPTNFITFRVNDQEKDILRAYCEKQGRTQTDVLRELIRNLEKENSTASLSVPSL